MADFFKNFKTRLSTQFASLTSLLIAIIVLFIASYSIKFMDGLAKEITAQSKELNKSISTTVTQVMSDYIDKNNWEQIDRSAKNMITTNLIASISITQDGVQKPLYETKGEKMEEILKENMNQKSLKKNKRQQDTNIYYISAPKGDKMITLGFYSEPIAKVYLDILIENMSAMVVIFIFLGFFLANLIAGILIKPISILIQSLKQAKGDFSHRLETTSYLEINRLIESYNNMAESLEKLYQSMEQQVKDRTSELEDAYSELKNTQAMMVHSEKMKSLGELVAGITHEINNPVNFIYGNLIHLNNYSKDLIAIIDKFSEYEGELSPEHKKLIDEIKQEVDYDFLKSDLPDLIRSCQEGTERTKNIVLDLKNFSRLEEAVITTIDLPRELDTTLNILHNKFKNKITVHKEFEDNLPQVEGYGGQLNQVFMNILDNAAFAIQEKGDVWIRLKSQGDKVILEIEDNGIGMDEKTAKKVFDPFFTTKPVGQGTGLGMAISYKVIKNHHGEINISSELGKGTKFVITLPLSMGK